MNKRLMNGISHMLFLSPNKFIPQSFFRKIIGELGDVLTQTSQTNNNDKITITAIPKLAFLNKPVLLFIFTRII